MEKKLITDLHEIVWKGKQNRKIGRIAEILKMLFIIIAATGCTKSRLEFDSFTPTSSSFVYNNSDAKKLNELYELVQPEKLFDQTDSEYLKIMKVSHFVYSFSEYDGKDNLSASDPISLFHEAKKGKTFRCVEYSVLIAGILQSIGFYARVVGLKMKDADIKESDYGAGHVVAEVFLPKYQKWVMIDGQWDAVIEYDGRPLNAVEVLQKIQNGKDVKIVGISWKSKLFFQRLYYKHWLKRYLYYFDTSTSNDLFSKEKKTDDSTIMLHAKDAKKISSFQTSIELSIGKYTTNVQEFYPKMPD